MLRIALPNKGSLSDEACTLMKEAGYKAKRDTKELSVTDTVNDVEFLFLRPRDIAVYVSRGIVDIGITGRDLLADSGAEAFPWALASPASSTRSPTAAPSTPRRSLTAPASPPAIRGLSSRT